MSNQITCKHIRGNGAHAFTCAKTGVRCLYQKWCEHKRIHELKPDCVKCKDFEK